MNWFIFALIAPVFYGLTNVIDKFLVVKVFRKNYFFALWMGIVSTPVLAFIFLFLKPLFIFPYTIIGFLVGALWTVFYFIYGKVLSNEEVSRTMSIIFIYPIFVSILAGIFLNEVFGISKYIGIFLLATSGLLICYEKKGKRISLMVSLKFIMILIFIWSITQVMDKFVVDNIGYWSLYFWTAFGVSSTSLPFFFIKKIRTNFVNSLKETWRKTLSTMIIVESFAIIATVSYYNAISLGPVSMVSAIGSIQPFLIFVYTIFLSIFMPKILKEELSSYNILTKSLAVVFVLVGTWLLI